MEVVAAQLDDVVVAIPVDALDAHLHIRCNEVLLTVSEISMQEVDAKDRHLVRRDLDVDSISMIPSMMM